MLIELIGPSGTGKTTALRALSDTATGRRGDFMSYEDYVLGQRAARQDKHGEEPPLLPVVLRHPRLALLILRLALVHGRPWKRRIRKAVRCLLNFSIAESLKRDYPDKLIVIDNGFSQTLWSLVVEAPELRGRDLIRQALGYYHGTIGQRGVRILVDDGLIIERVFSRESAGRFNRDAAPELRNAYARWLGYFRDIDSLAPPGMVVAELDGCLDPEQLSARLSAVIESMDGDLAAAR